MGRIEQGRAPGFTKPGAPVLAGAVLSPLVGVRIALEGGGVLLLAKRSRVTLTEHSLELSRGDALLDLRGAREDWILTVGGVSGQLVGGGRCLLGLRAGRSKLAVMNGVATLGEHSVATGRALELSARRGKVSPWVPGEPKWARKLRPAETLLLDLASDLRSGGGAWDNATLEEVGGRQTLVLGADGSGKHGVVASRRFKAVVGPDVELEVEVEVREALQIQINLKNDTRDDNSIWKFEAKPGGVQSFRRALGRFKAANKSRQAFREGDLANKITLYVGEPGETPRVVVFKVRLVKTR